MIRSAAALGSCALLAAGAAPGLHAQVFRTATRTVPVYATVLGSDGRLVTDLTRDDFEVLDEGRPQPIVTFDAGVQPIQLVIMLDMSGSMAGNLATLRASAVQMFTRLLPADRARVGNFGDRIVLSDAFTSDQDTLIRALYLDLRPGGATPLWRAVDTAMTALRSTAGRRVVLVLSDGRDSTGWGFDAGPPMTLGRVVARAQNEDFMIYAIGLRSRGDRGGRGASPAGSEPDPGLHLLAEESGGGYFELNGTADLGETFARVADELHRQYLLSFAAPALDGRLHRLRVRVRDPHMVVRARQSYIAPRGGRP